MMIRLSNFFFHIQAEAHEQSHHERVNSLPFIARIPLRQCKAEIAWHWRHAGQRDCRLPHTHTRARPTREERERRRQDRILGDEAVCRADRQCPQSIIMQVR